MGTVREAFAGRAVAGGVALLGVLLVVPSLVSPTWEMSVADREHGSRLSRQWEWSWGRVRVTGLEGVELRDQWNVAGLVVLLVVLAASLVGLVVWMLRRVAWGPVVALVTVALLAGRELTTVSARLGRSLVEVDRGVAGLTVRTEMTSAGSLETVAAVVLLVGLGLMVAATLLGRARGPEGAPVAPSAPAAAEGRTSAGRDRAPAAGLRPAGEHLSTSPVSFDETQGPGAADSADRTPTPGPPGRTGGRS